jgi:hypothetical protein
MQNLKKVFKNRDGSVLIGVVVITSIMGICAVAYASLVRNTVSDEILAFEDAKAYFAAEQGLLIATQWIGTETNWRSLMNNPGAVKILTTSDSLPVVNGLTCVDTLRYVSPTATKAGYMKIVSLVGKDGKRPYDKMLSWEITGSFNSASGSFAGCFNDMSDSVFGKDGIKGLHNRVAFLGPVHSNSPIQLSQRAFGAQQPTGNASDQGARFYGRVSIYKDWYGNNGHVNRTTADGYNGTPYWHNFGGNYTQGVMISQYTTGEGSVDNLSPADVLSPVLSSRNKNSDSVRTQLGKVFRQGFDPFANKMELKFDAKATTIDKKSINGTLLNGTVEGATYSNGNTSDNRATHTVFLKFGKTTDGTPYYQYSDASGNFTTITNAASCSNTNRCETYIVNNETVLYAGGYNNDGTIKSDNEAFNVMIDGGSTLAGKVTVVTAPNRDIIFNLYKGDILYDGMARGTGATTNGGENFANTNDLVYNSDGKLEGFTYVMGYVNKSSAAYEAMARDGGVDLGLKNSAGTTAGDNVFGFYSGGNVKLNLFHPSTETTSNSNQYNNTGRSDTYRNRTITAQLFAMNSGKKVYIADNGSTKRAYSFAHVAGTLVMDKWWDNNYDVRKENAGIRSYHDKRSQDGKSLSAPGLKYVEKDKDGNILLGMRMYAANWTETNR